MIENFLKKWGTYVTAGIGLLMGAAGPIDAGIVEIQTLNNELIGQVLFWSGSVVEVVKRVKGHVREALGR